MVASRRPRILLITTYYHPVVGGVERHARQLARCLVDNGFDVRILTKRIDAEAPAVEEIDGVPVHRVGPAGPRKASAKWTMLPALLLALFRLRDTYDLIYSPDYRGVGVAVVMAARLLRRPFVACSGTIGTLSCAHWDPAFRRLGLHPDGVVARAVKWPVRTIYSRADLFQCITNEIAREALACGIPAERVVYLPNGVDVLRFHPAGPERRNGLRAALGWPQDRAVCLFLARVSLEKGILDLLEAWRRLHPGRALLVVAGPDMPGHHLDAGPKVRRLLDSYALHDSVRLTGPTSTPERLLQAADIFVHPSHWEAAPFGMLEAMATGLAVVGTPVGGMGEYLVHEHNALLCPPRDPDCLANRMARLIDDPALRRTLGAEARRTVEREFDARAICARYAGLFTDAYAARRGSTT